MKRPLAAFGTVVLCSLAAVFSLGAGWGLRLLAGALALSLLLFLFLKKSAAAGRFALLCLAAGAGLCAGLLVQARCDAAQKEYAQTQRTLSVLVTQVSQRDGALYAEGIVQTADGAREPRLAVRFYIRENIRPGDAVEGRFSLGGDALDRTSARAVLFAQTQGTPAIVYRASRALSFAADVKARLRVALTAVLPGREGLLCAAVLTGEKTLLPAEMRLDFERAGLSHLLVVSGLHVSAILGLLDKILRGLRLPRAVCFGAIAAAAGCLALLYGFTPSVLRACAMTTLFVLSRLVYSRADGFTSLTAAALAIALFDARAVVDVSFLLSYACCFAIVEVLPRADAALCRRFPKLSVHRPHAVRATLRALPKALLLSCTVSAVTLPVLVLCSMPVSLVAPLSNLFAVPLVGLLLGASACAAAAFLLAPFGVLCNLAGLAAGLTAKAILAVARFFAGFSLAAVSLQPAYLRLWVLLAGGQWLLFRLSRGEVRARFAFACCAAALLCGVLSKAAFTQGRACVTLLNGHSAVVCGGGPACLVLQSVTAEEVQYLHAELKYRFIDDVDYVIIIKDASDGARAQLRELFAPDRLVCLADAPADDAVYLRRPAGVFGITANADGSVAVDGAGKTLLLCGAAPAYPQRYDALVYFEDAQDVVPGAYCVRSGGEAARMPDGAIYAYGDEITLYPSAQGIGTVIE
ncbi:MAG: ComEC/Rec2 family competence protein [Oscillospiraceae bacterium]|nr:ComEC/Rec2 family competence protein [Oscillospiraceae bacterium]